MRAAFLAKLAELAARDPRVVFLTGDLGFMVVEEFARRFPARFLNMGVAEQNMVGVATGLAEAGYLPFCYSIAPFASLRPYEFIRNGPVLRHLPVRIVGVGGGFEYGHAGPTHYGVEDVAVMRVQPGLTLVAPADHLQARTALDRTWDLPGPVYYRLGKDDRTVVPGLEGRFELGRVQVVREGRDFLLCSLGSVAVHVVAAASALAHGGIECTVAVVASVNPAPVEDLSALLSRFRVALAVEAHYEVGGLGSLVSEVAAERGLGCRVVRCGVKRAPSGACGSEAYMHGVHGLSAEAIARTAIRASGRGGA